MNYKRKRDAKARAELPLSEYIEEITPKEKKKEVEVNTDEHVKKSRNSNRGRGRRTS